MEEGGQLSVRLRQPARVRNGDAVPPSRIEHPVVVADQPAQRGPETPGRCHLERIKAAQLRRFQPGRVVSEGYVQLDY